jgi:hypothetical protein
MCELIAMGCSRLTIKEKDGDWCRRANMSRPRVGRLTMGRRYIEIDTVMIVAKESQVRKLEDPMALIDR